MGSVQKADGTCNTNFKTTKTQEQVLQVFAEFIEGNTTILVSLSSSGALILDQCSCSRAMLSLVQEIGIRIRRE